MGVDRHALPTTSDSFLSLLTHLPSGEGFPLPCDCVLWMLMVCNMEGARVGGFPPRWSAREHGLALVCKHAVTLG